MITVDGATPGDASAQPAWPNRVDAFLARLVTPQVRLDSRQLLLLLGVAGGLGLWADVLFAVDGLGVNLPLWLGSVVAATALSASRLGRPIARDRLVVLASAVALSMVVGWRDSVALRAFGLLGATALVFLGVGWPSGASVGRLSPISCAIACASGLGALTTTWWRALSRLPWRDSEALQRTSRALPVARALLIAAPLLLVFGVLFVAADAVFADGVNRIFALDLSGLAPHVARTLLGAWLALAMLWSVAAVEGPAGLSLQVPERLWLRRLEMAIVLGSLAALFAIFVVVQLRYLFGGADVVRASVVLTYAEYARRGFFELVLASLLLLPVLAAVNWARERSASAHRLFLVLAGVLAALLLVIMASAWQRLAIYREAFGLTELRLYALATLPWLIATLVTFLAAVAAHRTRAFTAAAIAYAALTLMVLDLLNPDAVIVRTNAARLAEGKLFDAAYAASLSADAVPALVLRLALLPESDRCSIAAALRRHEGATSDLRAWNYSRGLASRLVAQHRGELECG